MSDAGALRSSSVFLGVDLGWSTGATGLAAVDDTGRLTASACVETDDEIAEWIGLQLGHVVVAAVDAPLIVPNATGQRVPEKLIGQAFGGFGASAHTSNHARFPAGDTRAMRFAQRFGLAVDPRTPTGGDVGVCIEVYPHPALVGLFGLPYRLDYKKGNDQRRAPGFRLFVQHLESIPELALLSNPRWAELRQSIAAPRRGDLTRVEDELDAIVCAHLAWLWHHRRTALEVYGDVEVGYIVAPPPPLHRPQRPERRGEVASELASDRIERVVRGRPIDRSDGAGGGDGVTEAGPTAFRDQSLVSDCRCGCHEQVSPGARYRPGHDARHASQVGRAMIAAGAEDPALLATLPSEALRAKARAMLDRSASRGRPQPEGGVSRLSSLQEGPAVRLETPPAVMAVGPGTWHDSNPTTKAAWPVAVDAWIQATPTILERVAATYGGSITYEQLAHQLFDETGYRTRMLLGQWIGQVLGPVQAATLTGGKPPLSSLVVTAATGGVGDGYVNHEHPDGFASFAERQHAAAVDRLTCYRTYCDHVPGDAAPQMTPLYIAKQTSR
ncbi:DUF429 domain-containing protein [Blastococcus sp. TF02A-26]|uniref:DUF429 domain-containing protein n=1 Tax=Blastococcus sp. TF02A-26 TaxID=2250577 RepID=UPI0011BE1EA7|nr:DUF429 domain-containing protein [Blastococcus sp. TF02A-26]